MTQAIDTIHSVQNTDTYFISIYQHTNIKTYVPVHTAVGKAQNRMKANFNQPTN